MTDAEITLEPEGLEQARDAVRAVMDTEGPAPSPLAIALHAIRAYLSRSTLPREGQPTVVVKPLEWHGPDGDDEYYARSIIGIFTIGCEQRNGTRWSMGGYHTSIEEAKAAAQADFASRILSALSPSPAVRDGVVTELARKLEKAREALLEAVVVIDAEEEVESWNRINDALRALSTQEQGNG